MSACPHTYSSWVFSLFPFDQHNINTRKNGTWKVRISIVAFIRKHRRNYNVSAFHLSELNRPKSWCKECCVSTCLNGGTKSYPGACFCSCPRGWSGDICQNSRNYVLADLVFPSETLEEFSCLKVNWVLEGIVQLLNSPAVTISEAELDTIENFVSLRRVTSVRMVTLRCVLILSLCVFCV